jgi:LysM repeat protein
VRRAFFLVTLAALLLVILPASAGAVPEAAGASAGQAQSTGIYVVRQGDTLFSIASRHCMSTTELYSLNSSILNNPNQIYPGMQLRVVSRCGGGGNWGGVCDRGPSQHAQGSVWGNRYLVARGDTSYSIAARFGISVTTLCQANGINPWYIYAGQTLTIPGLTGSCGGGCVPGSWNCPPNDCWNCPPNNCWNCPPNNCANCPPNNCTPGWNCPIVTPVPWPTVVPVTPQPTAAAPFIQVDQPQPGQTLPTTFTVAGRGGGLFEGNVVVTAQTTTGAVLAQQATILQGPNVGAGGQGTFSVQLTPTGVTTLTPGWIIVSSPQSRVQPQFVSVFFSPANGSGTPIPTYHTYRGSQCRVTLVVGQPFHATVGGPQVGAFTTTGTFVATQGAKDQNNQYWFFVSPAPTNPTAIWIPATSVSSPSQACFF